MTKEEIEDLEEVKQNFKYTCDNNIEYLIKVINQLQEENESLKDTIRINNCVNESGIIQNQSAKIAELEEENEKQKEILDIIKNKCCISIFDLGYSDTVEEYNELYPLDSQLTDEEFKKIKEWLKNESVYGKGNL